MEFDELPEVEQRVLLKQLLEHAKTKLKHRCWRGQRGGVPPGGAEAEDVVVGILVKFREGKRTRNVARYPKLLDQLLAAVDSAIYAMVTREENKLERRPREEPREEDEPTAPWGDPERDLIDEEQAKLIHECFMEEVLSGDYDQADLIEAFDLAEKGLGTPQELEQSLGIPYEDARNLKKKVKRVMQKTLKRVQERNNARTN